MCTSMFNASTKLPAPSKGHSTRCMCLNALPRPTPGLRTAITSIKPHRVRSVIRVLVTSSVARPRQTSPDPDADPFKASMSDSISVGRRCFTVRDVSAGSCPNTGSQCPNTSTGPPWVEFMPSDSDR
ncbi:hypothetical protein DICSQDRAFT_154477 [Dichomitus squalens LYAD-421 SS1]|uniref:uncharacterized protein n=1 Tax=Dichomitus squalens (strain LYAD-421) TaxID=732165 RepID=UPI000441398F|nr:uncharacterized protein DICSQDRAFT_154477 [Dichomitus squalens LYAD-421 SS1]EJF62643.1 hypothetical protein DICSQDRAFT_154477 [Dichomitus squalens LYAD-421 SS1]